MLIVLKSSVILSDDLELAKKLNLQPALNLIKFHSLNESMIFRCFIRNKSLIAVSQKDLSSFNKYVTGMREEILGKSQEIVSNIINLCPMNSFTLDIYIDIPPRCRVFVLGFNSYSETTDPLLFTWEELDTATTVSIRVAEENTIKASSYSSYRVPIDITQADDIADFINSLPK